MPEDRRSTSGQASRPAPRRRVAGPSRSQRRRQSSVFQYIAVLFCAAFVLLLFTFMMERRQYQQLQEDNKQQSVSATQTLNGILEENQRLKEELAQSEVQSKDLADQLAAARDRQAETEARVQAMEKTAQAMDWFWQIDEAFVRGRYALCRGLIASLEEGGLENYLSRESITDNDRFSPYDRYMEIRGKVIK